MRQIGIKREIMMVRVQKQLVCVLTSTLLSGLMIDTRYYWAAAGNLELIEGSTSL